MQSENNYMLRAETPIEMLHKNDNNVSQPVEINDNNEYESSNDAF